MTSLSPEFDSICAALEIYEQYLMANAEDGAEDIITQFTEGAFEMLRQAQMVVTGFCPACGDECEKVHEEESDTRNVLSALFELDTDEGQLRLNLHQIDDGELMEVTEWVKCPPKEADGMVFYDITIATEKVLKLLAAQLYRKRKMAKQQ